MPAVNMPYVDAELAHAEHGDLYFWRHFHWGWFSDPEVDDDDPGRYLAAAEALTERLLTAAGVDDGHAVLDVGCGFGGTLDHIRGRNDGCRLVGLNIDHRQLRHGQGLLERHGRPGGPVTFVTADGCRLPVADGSVDHVLAVECVFHFPSRKAFFREAARVLRPGGTLALSDFVVADGSLPAVAATMAAVGVGDDSWYGHLAKPLSSAGYGRLGRGTGFDPAVDDDITAATLPTYPALRRLHRETEARDAVHDREQALHGLSTVDSLERLAVDGHLRYHLLTFRRR